MHPLPKSSAEWTGPDLASPLTAAPAQRPRPLVLLVLLMMNSMTSDSQARLAFPTPQNGENNEDVARTELVRNLTEIPVDGEGAVAAGAARRVLLFCLFLFVSVNHCALSPDAQPVERKRKGRWVGTSGPGCSRVDAQGVDGTARDGMG